MCNFDFYQCGIIDVSDANVNETCYQFYDDNNNLKKCFTSWTDDVFCDINCNVEQCNYDQGYCDSCIGDCETAYTFVISFLAALSEPVELITFNEFCDNWQQLQGLLTESLNGIDNCTIGFNTLDINNNGYIGYFEGILATSEYWGFDSMENLQSKLTQLDCSMCMTNQSLYYW